MRKGGRMLGSFLAGFALGIIALTMALALVVRTKQTKP
jgi:hypothetical protein